MQKNCQQCEGPLPAQERQGRPSVYCTTRCRVAAHRARKRLAAREMPTVMKRRRCWIRHDELKRPLTTHGWFASVNKPHTWTSHERAKTSEVGVGMGFVLGDGIGCIDLDHCIDDRGRLEPWAQRYVDRWREDAIMIERSRSGRGVHIFVWMEETKGRMIRLPGQSIEIYSWRRYIAVTGDRI